MKKILPLLFVFLILGASCISITPVIVAFEANPATITAGDSTILIWNVSGASSVSIDQGIGVLPAAGSRVVSPTITTVYTLEASTGLGTAYKSVVVNVNAAPIIINVDINPPVINSGGSAALIWNVSGASSVSIDQGIGNVPLSGNRVISPASTTTYTVTASGTGGTASKSAVLVVNPPVVATFNVNPSTINVGQSATLQWNVTGATSVTIDQGIGTVPPVGSRIVNPYMTTTYNLTASSSCCTVNKSVILTVGRYYPYDLYFYFYGYPYYGEYPYYGGYPFIDIFNVTPKTITAGGSATLQWYVSGASSVSISGIGNVPSSGSIAISPSSTTTYNLTARNYFGIRTASVTIQVQ
jgi:hypothetical protein